MAFSHDKNYSSTIANTILTTKTVELSANVQNILTQITQII